MNIVDLIIAVIVLLCALIGYRRGLIRTVYRLVSFFVAIFLANLFYPFVARFLRDTALFPMIQRGIISRLGLGDFVTSHAAATSAEIIAALPIPAPLRDFLHTRFEPNIHGILRVDTVEEHISAFFADIVINGISLFVVFILVFLVLSVVGGLLNVVGRLPIIRTFNELGGLVFGAALGIAIAWLCVAVASLLFVTGAFTDIYAMIHDSTIAAWLMRVAPPTLW